MQYYQDYEEPERPSEYYNTDAGNKETLSTRVAKSPQRYAIIQSGTERFPDSAHSKTPFGVYDTDTGNKKTVGTTVRDSKQLLAASFSKTSRWPKTITSAAPDVVYDTDLGRFQTIETATKNSPIAYANVRSKYRRFKPLNMPTDAPDIEYDTDTLNKATLTTSVKQSSIKYSIMKSPTKRFKEKPLTSTPDELGPGSYDPPSMLDLRSSQSNGPLSSFSSTSSRFGQKEDPSKFLGGTWSQDKDNKKWSEKGTFFSKAELRRPAYLPP